MMLWRVLSLVALFFLTLLNVVCTHLCKLYSIINNTCIMHWPEAWKLRLDSLTADSSVSCFFHTVSYHENYKLETRITDLHFASGSLCLSSFTFFFWWAPKNYSISARVTFQPFKVIQGHWLEHQSKARKRYEPVNNSMYFYIIVHMVAFVNLILKKMVVVVVVTFLLVRNSILHRCPFRLLPTPPLFHPNFGVFPLHQITHVAVNVSRGRTLFGRETIFEVFQTVWKKTYFNVTDGQTDDMQSYSRALQHHYHHYYYYYYCSISV